jgi:prevent-host-death family protein
MELDVHDAKTHLSKLLERVAQGEKVVIAKADKPVARLVAIRPNPTGRRIGTTKGAFVGPDDFNDSWPEFERSHRGKDPSGECGHKILRVPSRTALVILALAQSAAGERLLAVPLCGAG